MLHKYRQEVFNVLLAQLLQERGVIAAPEDIIRIEPGGLRRMPDVIVSFRGLRTAIEGEIGYSANAKKSALDSATSRIEENIAHIGIAIVYPNDLQKIEFSSLKNELANSLLNIAIVTESGPSEFAQGNVDYLESALRNAFDQLVQEDIVTKAVALLTGGIDRIANVLTTRIGDISRISQTLGIRELNEDNSGDNE